MKHKDHLYCSGVIGIGPDGKVSSNPETQFTQAFEGVKGVLEAAGLSFRDVVDITSFHVGLQANMRTFMKVKDRYIGSHTRPGVRLESPSLQCPAVSSKSK